MGIASSLRRAIVIKKKSQYGMYHFSCPLWILNGLIRYGLYVPSVLGNVEQYTIAWPERVVTQTQWNKCPHQPPLMSIGMQQYIIKQTGGSLYFVDTGVLQKQEFNVLNVRIQLHFSSPGRGRMIFFVLYTWTDTLPLVSSRRRFIYTYEYISITCFCSLL